MACTGVSPPHPRPSPCTHLHQRCGRAEAHLGHRLTLAPPRKPGEARAGAGEGAEGGGTGSDGRVRGAQAVGVIRHAEGPAPGQGVYDLVEGRRRRSRGARSSPQKLLPRPVENTVSPWTAMGTTPTPLHPEESLSPLAVPLRCYSPWGMLSHPELAPWHNPSPPSRKVSEVSMGPPDHPPRP